MTRDNLIEIVILSYLLGAACYNICTLVFFFWKQWSEIKKRIIYPNITLLFVLIIRQE